MEYNMEFYLSQIIEMPFSWQIRGSVPCRGQILPIQQYTALFALLGTSFGGDGVHNFALPDLRPEENGKKREWTYGETVKHICLEGVFPSRE
jgi:microcystin-dependent protein